MFFSNPPPPPSQYLRWICSLWSLAGGYKVSNTIEPEKTGDCHSNSTFFPHEFMGFTEDRKKKKKKYNRLFTLFMSQRIIMCLLINELNTTNRLILTDTVVL